MIGFACFLPKIVFFYSVVRASQVVLNLRQDRKSESVLSTRGEEGKERKKKQFSLPPLAIRGDFQRRRLHESVSDSFGKDKYVFGEAFTGW